MIEYNDDDAHRRELSRKLQLLMDVVEANSGQRPPYKEIAAEVEAQGASMSRPRWGYMLGGNGPAVRDPRLLAALASYFGVPAEYLTDAAGNTDVPERVQAQLELVLELRKREVVAFATRRLGEFASADEIRDFTEHLRRLDESGTTP
ncbi:hypothetical protein [Curtobacterium sp. VKM Ac-1376]|uniref:hypothetical protein n=1 Tax=Curtobacterium sp. VKM Ac-1376 TaxID=123312 RepID=UPI001889FCBA|nr:hypothetical protein [Curtobacterium sp. VKM Ac-1376]MBF4615349.1 hypothetical protein [Curtobacterium sp. VKM Ac-1376]